VDDSHKKRALTGVVRNVGLCKKGDVMPRVETQYFGPRQGGMMWIYCTTSETQKVADAAGGISAVTAVFANFVEPVILRIISSSAGLLSWKAKRCLDRGKLLMIECYGVIPIPREYEP
jgi:hypothetical protein